MIRELTEVETEEVNGAVLANIGAGIGGASVAMGGYAIYGATNGSMSLGGFAGAGVAGFIGGATFGNPYGVTAGMAAGGAVNRWLDC